MNEINLREEDTKTIKNFVLKYNEVHDSIGNVEKEMLELQNKTVDLVESLTQLRESEKDFISSLENVYGPGKFDSAKMKWIKK